MPLQNPRALFLFLSFQSQLATKPALQDDTSNPGVPFACGLTLEKLSAHTVDEAGNQAFVKDNPLSLLRKVTPTLRLADLTSSVVDVNACVPSLIQA